jgi:autotransporter-associated beta strand protein
MGGAVFVMEGASLTIVGKSTLAGGAQGGTAGAGGTDGQAYGGALFLQGSGNVRFNPGPGQTEHVFNAIDDEAGVVAKGYKAPSDDVPPGSYRLIKSGLGTLVLSADNAYSGSTTLRSGTLDLTAHSAAGTGAVTFKGSATLEIANAALSSNVFGNSIDTFGPHDVLDLSGLHFHAGATATYHKAAHHLTVESGGVTDTLALLSPHGTHFTTANDGHGGTDVFLLFA